MVWVNSKNCLIADVIVLLFRAVVRQESVKTGHLRFDDFD
ncbi:MAG: hypothetical protein ACJAW1_002801 [Glaciecola sp.]|jgi:hypothetical protein